MLFLFTIQEPQPSGFYNFKKLANTNMDRNHSVPSNSDVDASSVECFESFDESYDRIVKLTQEQQDNTEDVANELLPTKQVENAEVRVGPVINISKEFVEKGGEFNNIFNYHLRLNICSSTTSKMIIGGLCLLVCIIIATTLILTLDNPEHAHLWSNVQVRFCVCPKKTSKGGMHKI